MVNGFGADWVDGLVASMDKVCTKSADFTKKSWTDSSVAKAWFNRKRMDFGKKWP